MKAHNRSDYYKQIFVVSVIYILGVIIHFCCADFNKVMRIYPDELYYYKIANSLYSGDGLSVRGIGTDFTKIAYALVLAPFFGIHNSFLRIRVIGFVNSMIMMASVFPVWGITKEIGLEKKNQYLLLFLTILWPDTMLTMTFMSEVLYWPLFFIFTYLWIVNEKKQKVSIAVVMGITCYVGYLCKEIFLAVLLAHLICEIGCHLFFFLQSYKRKREGLYASIRLDQKCFKIDTVFVSVFLICHLLMTVTIFSGVEKLYKLNLSVIFEPYCFGYILYGFLYYLAALLITSLFLPFIYPAININKMGRKSRKLYCYIIAFFLILTGIIAITITVREDLGKITPRIHLRYFGPAFIVLLTTFFSCIENIGHASESLKRKRDLIVIGGTLFFGCTLFKGLTFFMIDQQALDWYFMLQQKIGVLQDKNGNPYTVYLYAVVANFLLVIIVFSLHYLYVHISRRAVRNAFALVIVIACVVNDCIAQKIIHKDMYVDDSVVDEIVCMNEYFQKQSGNVDILYFSDQKVAYIDTYFNEIEHLYYVNSEFMQTIETNKVVDVSETKFYEPRWEKAYKDVSQIDFFIVENPNGFEIKRLAGVELVSGIGGDNFKVYRNLDPNTILFEWNRNICFSGSEMKIHFTGNEYNASNYVLSGISYQEEDFSWTEGDKMEVLVPADANYSKLKICLSVLGTFQGSQSYVVCQDKSVIASGSIEGKGEIKFEMIPSDHEIRFDILFPDALVVHDVWADSTDERKIAFQLKEMSLRCSN